MYASPSSHNLLLAVYTTPLQARGPTCSSFSLLIATVFEFEKDKIHTSMASLQGVPPPILHGGIAPHRPMHSGFARRDLQGRVVNGLLFAVGATNEVVPRSKPDAAPPLRSSTEMILPRPASRATPPPAPGTEKKAPIKKKRKSANTATSSTSPVMTLYCLCHSPWNETSSGPMVGCDGPCKCWSCLLVSFSP